MEGIYGSEITPERILYYIYTILHSETYREKYSEFLKTNFPRIPFTKNAHCFFELSQFGEDLAKLHMLKSALLNEPVVRFQGKGDNIVAKPVYDGKDRVYMNANQYFDGIKPEVWVYQVGGYQVLFQWLKDRKTRVLSLEDMKQYCKIATTICNTIEIQKKIDEVYCGLGKDLVKLEKLKVSALENAS